MAPLLGAIAALLGAHRPARAEDVPSALCVTGDEAEAIGDSLAYTRWTRGRDVCFGVFASAEGARASRATHEALARARVVPAPRTRRPRELWLGEPVRADGHVPFVGFRRGRTRDVVLVQKTDSFEGEPNADWLVVLDGPTGTARVFRVWESVLTADERHVVLGVGYGAFDEGGRRTRESLLRRVARDAELPIDEVRAAAFEDGFTDASAYIVRPFALSLDSGALVGLDVAAGGAMSRIEERIVATRRPRYWAFPTWDATPSTEPIFELFADPPHATPIAEPAASRARARLARDAGQRFVMAEDRVPADRGASFARTRDGRLMLRVVRGATDVAWWLQPVRLSRAAS
jgi:hypothetical protein